MSWLRGLSATNSTRSGNPNFTAEARAEKRAKLEADRVLKNQRKADRQNYFRVGISAPPSPTSLSKSVTPTQEVIDEECQSLPDLFLIDISLFDDIEADRFVMANFDERDADNADDAMKHLGQIKVTWDSEDPSYFFQKLETELQIFGVNKQFTKRQALIRCLPDDVGKEFKHLTTLQEAQAGNLAYKVLKTALIKAYGPRPGDAFQRAMSRVMVAKPSSLLKLLVSDICQQNLANCCCSSTVWGIFQLQAPMYLKNGLANEVFNSTNMQSIMDKADNLYAANQVTKQVSAVSPPDTTQNTTNAEVAAVGRGRGNFRGRGGRGRGGRGGRGGQAQSSGPDPRGKRHESNPPWNSCGAHWVYADAAFKCQSPTTCPMKDKVKPKTQA